MKDSAQKFPDPELTNAIDQAIHTEEKIHNFYLKSLERLIDSNGKHILKSLAEIEQNHKEILTNLKESFLCDWDENECKKMTQLILNATIDFGDFDPVQPGQEDLLDILGKAIEAESTAYELYCSLAERIPYPAGKDIFIRLAEEEMHHRQILSREFHILNQKL